MQRPFPPRQAAVLAVIAVLQALPITDSMVVAQDDAGPPLPPAVAPMRVGLLVLEGVYNSELIAPMDIFQHTVFHTQPGMQVFTVGRAKGMVRSFEGLQIGVEHDLESAPPIDVLVVPSAEHNMDTDLEDERLVGWLRERGATARYVLSICDGAFLLAEAGLLEGRRCTTFPGDIPAFRRRYPDLTVVEGVDFVSDRRAITGVGGARSYAPALFLVEHLYGPEVARGVAKGMVIDWDLDRGRRLVMPDDGSEVHCYLPGDRVDPEVSVVSFEGKPITLANLVASQRDVRAVVLCIAGGAETRARQPRGGFWCEDTFNEIPNLRHLRLKYGPRGVIFIGVLCPPVYDETRYGYMGRTFLEAPADEPAFRRSRRAFTLATGKLVENGQVPFDIVVFDLRFGLLGEPARMRQYAAVEPFPSWQGRFRWFEETQVYGTPTTWILTPDLEILGPPFVMNVYEAKERKLRYTADDIGEALDRMLEDGATRSSTPVP